MGDYFSLSRRAINKILVLSINFLAIRCSALAVLWRLKQQSIARHNVIIEVVCQSLNRATYPINIIFDLEKVLCIIPQNNVFRKGRNL
jgi:hypothetical protein